MKLIITSDSEVDLNGIQQVAFNITENDGTVLVSGSHQGAVETVKEEVIAIATEYKARYRSAKRLKTGDEINI